MRHQPAPRKSTSGFTLVELLVVLSIIAILFAMLLPSIQAAKELAHQTHCMSRQRHVSLGCMLYNNDNAAWWPVNNTYALGPAYLKNPKFAYRAGSSSGQLTFLYQVRPYMNIRDPAATPTYDPRPYSPAKNQLLCPASPYTYKVGDPPSASYNACVLGDALQPANYFISAYFGNGDPYTNDPATNPSGSNARYLPKRGDPMRPDRLAFIGESIGTSSYFGYLAPNYLPQYYAYFHVRDTINVGFADGHSANLTSLISVPSSTLEWYSPIN